MTIERGDPSGRIARERERERERWEVSERRVTHSRYLQNANIYSNSFVFLGLMSTRGIGAFTEKRFAPRACTTSRRTQPCG